MDKTIQFIELRLILQCVCEIPNIYYAKLNNVYRDVYRLSLITRVIRYYKVYTYEL